MSQITRAAGLHYDVVIVGARCAGSAAAATFARAGKSVLVLERAKFPAETLSSHTMFAGTIDEVRAVGALSYLQRLSPPDLCDFRMPMAAPGRSRIHYHEVVPTGSVTSVRRYLLDQALVDMARDVNAEVREQSEVVGVVWRGGRVVGVRYRGRDGTEHEVRSSLVLGADGQFSTVADLVGASEPYRWSFSPRAAMLRYVQDPVTQGPEATTVFHSRQGSSLAFSFPTTPLGQTVIMFVDARASVEVARADPEGVWQSKLALHPELHDRYSKVEEQDGVKVFDELTSFFRPASGPGWGLIGDAGHFKDPIIGQGIRDALWSGRTIAEHALPVLDSPEQLDRALRRWERERELECALPYLMGVWESSDQEDSDAMRLLVGALSERGVPLAAVLGTRSGATLKRLGRRAIAMAAVDALRHSERPIHTFREFAKDGSAMLGGTLRVRPRSFRSRSPHQWERPVKEPLESLLESVQVPSSKDVAA